MGGSDYTTPGTSNSRIADSNRSWQAACDVDVINWTKTNEFIVSLIAVATGHNGGGQITVKVQWMKDSEAVWYDLAAASGELRQGTGTALTNSTTPIEEANRSGCNGGLSHGDSHEIEGANSCIIGAIAQNTFIEIQVAVDPANAIDSEKYSFRLYDVTENAALDEVLAEITMAGVTFVLLEGTTGAQSSASGGSKVAKKIIGTSPGVSGLSASVKLSKKVSGAIAGQSGISGIGKVTREVVGSLGGISNIPNVAPRVTRKVDGAIPGSSSITGAAKVNRKMVGAIAGVAVPSGSLKTTKEIDATIDAISSASATLSLEGAGGGDTTIGGFP